MCCARWLDVPSSPLGSALFIQATNQSFDTTPSSDQRNNVDDRSDCSSENDDFFDAEENMRWVTSLNIELSAADECAWSVITY
jgi:hypothetical protein